MIKKSGSEGRGSAVAASLRREANKPHLRLQEWISGASTSTCFVIVLVCLGAFRQSAQKFSQFSSGPLN